VTDIPAATQVPVDQAVPEDAAARVGDPGRPHVLVIGNAAAGSADEERVAEAMVALRERADVELVVPADLEELRAALEVQGPRRLVVLGGDGSMHAVAGALDRLGRLREAGPVGVVPLGTGNDLARTLGVPLDLTEAAHVALGGIARTADVLRADDGTLVVNAVHAGIGAEAAARTGAHGGALGAAGYAVGAVAAGLVEKGWRLRVTVDGEPLDDGSEPLLMVAVSVGRSIGGGAEVAPGASPFDGVADVVVSHSTGPLERVGFALSMRRGAHTGRDDIRTVRGREVVVEASDDDSAFRTDADGEVQGPFTRRSWRVEPGAWQLVAPA
jgi:YegS/Rv2252/BmrU family lipid kinase